MVQYLVLHHASLMSVHDLLLLVAVLTEKNVVKIALWQLFQSSSDDPLPLNKMPTRYLFRLISDMLFCHRIFELD